jgi:hypothetical protein
VGKITEEENQITEQKKNNRMFVERTKGKRDSFGSKAHVAVHFHDQEDIE